eukprot:gene6699-4797_t
MIEHSSLLFLALFFSFFGVGVVELPSNISIASFLSHINAFLRRRVTRVLYSLSLLGDPHTRRLA